MSSPVPGPPLIDSPTAAGKALCDLFLANADRGDNTANDELVAELVRRIRARHNSSNSGDDQPAPSHPGLSVDPPEAGATAAQVGLPPNAQPPELPGGCHSGADDVEGR